MANSKTPVNIVLEILGAGEPKQDQPQTYLVRRTRGGFEPREFTWDDSLRRGLEQLKTASPDRPMLEGLGEKLARFLGTEVERLLETPEATPIHVTIRLHAVARAFSALPWELTPLGEKGPKLATLRHCQIRYEWEGSATTAPRIDTTGAERTRQQGRILFAHTSAGQQNVPHASHRQAIARACAAAHIDFAGAGAVGSPAEDEVGEAPFSTVVERLRLAASEVGRGPFSILHILCHGKRLESDTDTYGLAWPGSDDRPTVITPDYLADLLRPFMGTLRLVVLCVCKAGDGGTPGNPMGSVADRLHMSGCAAVIASRFPLTVPGSNLFTAEFYDQLLARPSSVEEAFLAARNQLFERLGAKNVDHASLQLWARAADGWDTRPVLFPPYRGLRGFEFAQAKFFFGREEETRALVARLKAGVRGELPRFQVLAAASGTGKSSLVRAGVAPALARDGWTHQILRPSDDAARLADISRSDDVTGASAKRPCLVIVDQFEEIFTHTVDPAFVKKLWILAGSPHVAVLCALRVDFFGRCGAIVVDDEGRRLDKVVFDADHRTFLARLDRPEMTAIVERPAQLVGLELAEGLVNRLLEDVDEEPGALPLLEYALSLLWERRTGRVLSHGVYDNFGGAVGALARTADTVFKKLGIDPDDDRAPSTIHVQAQRLLVALVDLREEGAFDTRKRVLVDELRPPAADVAARAGFDVIVATLVQERMLVEGDESGKPYLELAHDELIRQWAWLRKWRDRYRAVRLELERFKEWVRQWRDHKTLLQGSQLRRAIELVTRYPMDVTADMRALVDASKRRRRREVAMNLLLSLFVLTLIVALVIAGNGLLQSQGVQEAIKKKAEDKADQDAKDIANAQLAAESYARGGRDTKRMEAASKALNDDRVALALAFIREVEAEHPETVDGWSLSAHEMLAAPLREFATLRNLDFWFGMAAFNADGTRLLIGAQLWDTRTGQELVLPGRGHFAASAGFSPNNKHMVTVSGDRKAQLWSAQTGEEVRFPGWEAGLTALAFSSDGLRMAAALPNHTTQILNASTGVLEVTFGEHTAPVHSLAFSADGKRVLTASLDGTARVWSLATRTPIVLRAPGGSLHGARFCDTDSCVLTASEDRWVAIWDATTGSLRGPGLNIDRPGEWPESCRISAAGDRILDLSDEMGDGAARLLDVRSGRLLAALRHKQGPLRTGHFSPDGAQVLTETETDTYVWSATTGASVGFPGRQTVFEDVDYSPDGRLVVTVSAEDMDGRAASVWDSRTGASIAALEEPGASIYSARFTPNGAHVVTAAAVGEETKIRLWNVRTWEDVAHFENIDLEKSVFNPDYSQVVTSYRGRAPALWALGSGIKLAVARGHEDGVTSAVFSPDGSQLLTTSQDQTARVWDATTGLERAMLPPVLPSASPSAFMQSAKFSPDGRSVVTASHWTDRIHGESRVWAVDGPMLITTIHHGGLINSVAFSPRGGLVSTNADGSAELWEANTGRLVRVVAEGTVESSRAAAYSADGTRLVTALADRTARVWDAATGTELAVLRGHEGRITSAKFVLDDLHVVTMSDDNTVRIWDAETGAPGSKLAVKDPHSAELSVDGEFVLTASADGARLWKADDGERVRDLGDRKSSVAWAKFSPDGSRVLMHPAGEAVQLWDWRADKQISAFRHPKGDIRSADFSPDGSRVVTSSSDRTAQVWMSEVSLELLWRATAVCPSSEVRVKFLGEAPEAADAAARRCEAMIRCLHVPAAGPAKFEACLVEFRRPRPAP